MPVDLQQRVVARITVSLDCVEKTKNKKLASPRRRFGRRGTILLRSIQSALKGLFTLLLEPERHRCLERVDVGLVLDILREQVLRLFLPIRVCLVRLRGAGAVLQNICQFITASGDACTLTKATIGDFSSL
jgi:hypothetical protein